MKQKKYTAWAIDANTSEGHGLIGQYWWNYSKEVPIHMQGTKAAFFRLRKIARSHLPSVKDVFPKAKVVKVSITLEWE